MKVHKGSAVGPSRHLDPAHFAKHERVDHPLARLSTSERRAIIHLGMTPEQKQKYLEDHPQDRARLERALRKRIRKQRHETVR